MTVIMLVNDRKNSGIYSTMWNGADESGVSVSSGIYYAVLINNTNGNVVKNKGKVFLIK